tara:strand:- start:78 stop:764 length:687 start_codon:yes stop_codon:yes gene_type:complete
MKNNLLDFIKESAKRGKKAQKEYTFGDGYVYVKNPLPDTIDLAYVLDTIEELIPPAMRAAVESIFVGDFEEFHEREINALFKDGAVYVTNAQTDNDDMIDDIVHEIAHSAEDLYGYEIYASDNKLMNEFRQKRISFEKLLKSQGFRTQGYDFEDVEYNLDFDDYLYQEVGYPTLESLTVGLFPNAYSPTSIREYFASGFEMYFLGDRHYLKKISPVLYRKIEEIMKDD